MKEKKNYVPEDRKVTVGLDKEGHKIEEIISGYANADRNFESINLSYNIIKAIFLIQILEIK